jgi:hypothetical protein
MRDNSEFNLGGSVLDVPVSSLSTYIERTAEQIANGGAPTREELSRAEEAARLLRELLTFTSPPGPDLAREDLEAGATALARFATPEAVRKAYFAAGEHRKGRPVVRRHVAAAALEYKNANPQASRLALARRFCPCGRARHDDNCAKRLRRDIQRLNVLIREILEKYPASE